MHFSHFPIYAIHLSSGAPGDSQKVSSWPEEKIQVSARPTPMPPVCWDYRNVHSGLVSFCFCDVGDPTWGLVHVRPSVLPLNYIYLWTQVVAWFSKMADT